MKNELTRFSRAGDAFHYRWAARRCLQLIYPKTLLKSVVIEGSEESELAGEYVIDVTEYWDESEGEKQRIIYYQLKHTTEKKDVPFTLSNLRGTVSGFAKRYADL